MTTPEAALERLVSSSVWQPNWTDVLARAGERPAKKARVARRRLILAVALLVAVVVPLTALSAANDWWFFNVRGAPSPSSSPVVVKAGSWDGHPWQLVAYPSNTGLCFAVTPSSVATSSQGAGLACAPIVGFTPATSRGHSPGMAITYLSSSSSKRLPAYIAGPVIDTATTVEIRFTDGHTVRTPTFAAPAPLNHVRFYATRLPAGEGMISHTRRGSPLFPLAWVAGLDSRGTIVACLAPATAKGGVSARSDCA